MAAIDFLQRPHRRLNRLTGEWVLVSPHRTQRPWQGKLEHVPESGIPYDSSCYLCPGNARAGGIHNPQYASTFVFTNDFAALLPAVPGERSEGPIDLDERGLMVAARESGACRVICFSPRHDLTLSRMPLADIENVVSVWAAQYSELAGQHGIGYVQIFENRGEIMGCSNAHPHCQVWATESIPNEPSKELRAQAKYFQQSGVCLLCDYLKTEQNAKDRIVCENDQFLALVPFWAVWPFEVLLIAKTHAADWLALDNAALRGLADILKRLTTRYDNLFEVPFPYSMGFHAAPIDGAPHPEWHFHAHFYPPLLRSATIKKFMVGYELLAEPQRDLTPEAAAEQLRGLSEQHYADRK
jgi:UDPglucose--hexose-1-phosphate uridylyltransferase